jgi:hypothetical protein
MVMPLSTISMLFRSTQASGGIDFSFITQGAASGATGTADAGSIKIALVNAEKNEAKQLAQVARDPQVVRDLTRYEKVLRNAETIDDVLDDPIARKVLMTANGLKADVDNIGLLKRALLSDPSDPRSVAVQMSRINGAWIDFARKFDLAEYGLDRLYPQMDGIAGRWRINLDREGETIEAMLEIRQVAVPITVDGEDVTLDLLWRDAADELHTSRLTGTLGPDGLSGAQADDGVPIAAGWTATPYFSDALKDVSDSYIAEKRLDMLDQQLPGLGSAVLFKQVARTFETAIDILGSPLAREVVSVAFNIPKQIAIQSIPAQEKAINQRLNPAKLADERYADIVAQRYLIMLNGGLGGVTA